LVADETHKLPEAARQMYSQSLSGEDMGVTVYRLAVYLILRFLRDHGVALITWEDINFDECTVRIE